MLFGLPLDEDGDVIMGEGDMNPQTRDPCIGPYRHSKTELGKPGLGTALGGVFGTGSGMSSGMSSGLNLGQPGTGFGTSSGMSLNMGSGLGTNSLFKNTTSGNLLSGKMSIW